MKLFSLLIIALSFVSCATHTKDKTVAHHHHRSKMNCTKCPTWVKATYDDTCEESIAPEDRHTANKEEFQLYHDGHHYYFTSQEKMDQFIKIHK